MNTLSYETCVALRDAGFPQDVSPVTGWWTSKYRNQTAPKFLRFTDPPFANKVRPEHYVACPNSDELWAEMRARMHATGHTQAIISVGEGDFAMYYADVYECGVWGGSETAAAQPQGEGQSPVEALAALFICVVPQPTKDVPHE